MMEALLAALLGASWMLAGIDLAHAQPYPNRPIRMVVPFPAGGPTDGMARIISDRLSVVLGQTMARIISDRLSVVLGQTVVVENRGGGAGGRSLTSGPAVHANIGYDPVKVFVPVCEVIETPQILAVHHDLPVKTVTDLVKYAKASPGKISWGSQGFGTAPHLLAELFRLETGVNIVHVPYRGTAPMLAAVVAGEVQVVIDPMTTVLPHIQSGALRALAIAGAERSPKLPHVPTAPEAGFPNLLSPFWLGVVAPAGTAPTIIDKLNAAFRESLADAETRALLDRLGAEIKVGTPVEFEKMLADERAKWTAVVNAANIKVD
jgi:tripartite-type tricarboxylate transporter receptor subunit TctC